MHFLFLQLIKYQLDGIIIELGILMSSNSAIKSGSNGRIQVHTGCGHLSQTWVLCHQVNQQPIQAWWPNARAIEFELVRNSLIGKHPSLNWVATPNINSDAAIQPMFSGCVILNYFFHFFLINMGGQWFCVQSIVGHLVASYM